MYFHKLPGPDPPYIITEYLYIIDPHFLNYYGNSFTYLIFFTTHHSQQEHTGKTTQPIINPHIYLFNLFILAISSLMKNIYHFSSIKVMHWLSAYYIFKSFPRGTCFCGIIPQTS